MTFTDSKGDQLSIPQVIGEGLTADIIDQVSCNTNPESQVSAMEDEAFDEWELAKQYSRNTQTFREFFKEFQAI